MNKNLPLQYHSGDSQQIAVYDPMMNPVESEAEISLLDIWRIVKKYKWTILAFFPVSYVDDCNFNVADAPRLYCISVD